jgi:hypothetical protein
MALELEKRIMRFEKPSGFGVSNGWEISEIMPISLLLSVTFVVTASGTAGNREPLLRVQNKNGRTIVSFSADQEIGPGETWRVNFAAIGEEISCGENDTHMVPISTNCYLEPGDVVTIGGFKSDDNFSFEVMSVLLHPFF